MNDRSVVDGCGVVDARGLVDVRGVVDVRCVVHSLRQEGHVHR